MAQVIGTPQPKQSFSSQLGLSIGRGAAEGIAGGIQQGQERRAQEKEDKKLKELGVDLQGIRDPNIRAQLFAAQLKKKSTAEASLNSIPEHLRRGNSNTSPTMADQLVGNSPISNRIKTEQEIDQEAADTAQRKGTDFEEEKGKLQRTKHGQLADKQILESFSQEVNNQLATSLGSKYTPEIGAAFEREAEQLGLKNLEPSEQRKATARAVNRFKNDLSNMESHIKPNKMTNYLTADKKSNEKRLTELRSQVKPFIEKGLYDEGRAVLADKGYYPEEIEEVVSTGLSEPVKKELINFPSFKTASNEKEMSPWDVESAPWETFKLNPQETDKFVDSLSSVLKKDPSTNLVLLRKAYEDKGVDWDTFKTAVEELQLTGQFNPEDDTQLNQMGSTLKEPPLGYLGRLLHAVKLGGR
ncbi:MAG: hypothetical protein V4708_17050 [Bacteroidota bacterium]